MALKIIGQAPCPFCGQPARVGISLNGEGNAAHLMCGPCQMQVQAHRDSVVGRRMGQAVGTVELASETADPWAKFWNADGQTAKVGRST